MIKIIFFSDANKTLGRTFYGVVGAGVFNLEKVSPPEGERIVTTTRLIDIYIILNSFILSFDMLSQCAYVLLKS